VRIGLLLPTMFVFEIELGLEHLPALVQPGRLAGVLARHRGERRDRQHQPEMLFVEARAAARIRLRPGRADGAPERDHGATAAVRPPASTIMATR
jgi:hypothetical protein